VNAAKFQTREFPAMREAFVRVAERVVIWHRAARRAERLHERYCRVLDVMTPVVKAAKPVVSDYQI
jgi:hypothetical protein